MLKDVEQRFNELYPDEGIAELIRESGGKLTKDLIRKKFIVEELSYLFASSDPMQAKYFDDDSYEMLDLKIEVLTALKDGKPPDQIPRYYEIFELLPPEGQVWD